MTDDKKKNRLNDDIPEDPSIDTYDFNADETGRAGVTTMNPSGPIHNQTKPRPNQDPRALSSARYNDTKMLRSDPKQGNQIDPSTQFQHPPKDNPMTDDDNADELKSAANKARLDEDVTTSPDEEGQQSVSGSEPDPSSDDDTLASEQQVGHNINEDLEHPKELNHASDLDAAERYQRTH